MTTELLNDDYLEAAKIYTTRPPNILGRLVLGSDQTAALPVCLDAVYEQALQTIAAEPRLARDWAATFGMLNVGVALDGSATNFTFESTNAFKPPTVAELQTNRLLPLRESFYSSEKDAPLAFILADDSQVIELALIKALHMLDFAIATKQIVPGEQCPLYRPIVVCAEPEELLRLRQDNSDVRLRLYGNVRNRLDATRLLGTVVPTQLLETSGLEVKGFSAEPKPKAVVKKREAITLARQPVAGIGITTGKRPHIGHAFLLAKAYSEAGQGGTVLAELNDLGPRVVGAVRAYADREELSFQEAAERISSEAATMDDIENAYRSRALALAGDDLPQGFSLTAANRYVNTILRLIIGAKDLLTIPNSDLESDLMRRLLSNPNTIELFGNSGMSLLTNASQEAVVIESAGKPTLAGIIGALSTKYAMTFVDSPRPIDARTQKIFAEAGLNVELTTGMGLSIDFGVASGTKGTAPTIESLIVDATSQGYNSSDVLTACRLMLNQAYYVPGDGGSLNPNYASPAVVLDMFRAALRQVDSLDDRIIYAPMEFKRVEKTVAVGAFQKIMGDVELTNKPSVGAVLLLQRAFPELKFSPQTLAFAEENNMTPEMGIPKRARGNCDQYWSKLFSGNPDFLFKLLIGFTSRNPDTAAQLFEGTELASAMAGMGYSGVEIGSFLVKLKGAQRVGKLK